MSPNGPSGNSVTVNGDVPGDVHGGSDYYTNGINAAATNNRVTVSGGSMGSVFGGYAESDSGSATVTGNSVSISGGSTGDVLGGAAYSYSGMAVDSIPIAIGFVPSGYAGSGSGSATAKATDNSVRISGGTIYGNVHGGHASSNSGSAIATGNSVSISGGTIGKIVNLALDSHSGRALALATVIAPPEDLDLDPAPAPAPAEDPDPAPAEDPDPTEGPNTDTDMAPPKTISSLVSGGYAYSYFGNATVTGNSISISGGTIHENVSGGYAYSYFGSAMATGNSISISGGSIHGNVYGGAAYSSSGSAMATDNSVTLSGAPVFDAANEIWGGQALVAGTPSGDAFTKNALNVWNYSGNAVKSVQNFQYYNFVLPAAMQNGRTLLTVTGTAYFDDSQSGAKNGSRSTITGVGIMGGGTPLQAGDSVTLMRYGSLGNNANAVNGNSIVAGRKGVSLLYDFQLKQTPTGLTATVIGSPRLNPQAKALSEGRAAGMAFVNQGADLAAGSGLSAAANAGSGLSSFAAFQGGSSRYKTGSHVDVNGSSLMTGLAWNKQTDCGALLLGAFFEAGWGNYNSYNSFSGYASVKGNGDTEYYGGGMLSRFDFANTGPGHIYAEASLRTGWAETDFSSGDLRDPIGQNAHYDSGALYYGAHLGLGYVWNITETASLDMYTKYFWTHQDSDSVSVAGDSVKFDSVDSHRWRGGARFGYDLMTEQGPTLTPYIGAAYEHEFDGKARATTYGRSIDAPDLIGGTGMGELGLSAKPSVNSKLNGLCLDVGLQGYTGMREGVSGSLQVRFEF